LYAQPEALEARRTKRIELPRPLPSSPAALDCPKCSGRRQEEKKGEAKERKGKGKERKKHQKLKRKMEANCKQKKPKAERERRNERDPDARCQLLATPREVGSGGEGDKEKKRPRRGV